jgi:hypothetical protein
MGHRHREDQAAAAAPATAASEPAAPPAPAMTTASPCLTPGCGELVDGYGYCERHQGRTPGAPRRAPRRGEPWSRAGWTARARALVRQVGRCQRCGSTRQLVAHHTSYDPERPGIVDASSPLVVLCRSCHSREHRLAERDQRRASSARPPSASISRAGEGMQGFDAPRRYSLPPAAKKTARRMSGMVSKNPRGGADG